MLLAPPIGNKHFCKTKAACLELAALLLALQLSCKHIPANVSAAGATMSTGVQPPANPDPLRETSRYTKVADLSHGSFGFVQLARNTETQELVAIKFIERGDRVNRCASSSSSYSSAGAAVRAVRGSSCGGSRAWLLI
jgi:hypothetical protein